MLAEISDLDTNIINDEIRSLFSSYDPEEELGNAIRANSVSKYPDGKGPEDLTKRWSLKTGKPELDKHQRGNNQDSRLKDAGISNKTREFLTTLSLDDGLEEIAQENADDPSLKDADQYYSDEQSQQEYDSYDGNWRNWENSIVDGTGVNNPQKERILSDKDAKYLSDISRKEKYFGRNSH